MSFYFCQIAQAGERCFKIRIKLLFIIFLLPLIAACLQFLDASAQAESIQSYCQCSEGFSYSFRLMNPERYDDRFIITSPNRYEGFAFFSESDVFLEAGQAIDISVTFYPGCVLGRGIHRLNVSVYSVAKRAESHVPIVFNIASCFGHEIELGSAFEIGEERIDFTAHSGNYSACGGANAGIPILIRNVGAEEDRFAFSLRGPAFARLSGRDVILEPESEGALYITMAVPESAEGDYNFILRVSSDNFGRQRDYPFKVSVADCYGVDAEFWEDEIVSCGCERETASLVISNEGAVDDSYTFTVSGPDYARLLLNASLTVEAKGRRNVTLFADAPCDGRGSDVLLVSVESENDAGTADEARLEISYFPNESCYGISTEVPKSIRITPKGGRQELAIENTGKKTAIADLDMIDPEWAYIDVNKVELRPNERAIVGVRFLPLPDTAVGRYNYSIRVETDSSAQILEGSVQVELPFDLGEATIGFFARNWILIAYLLLLLLVGYMIAAEHIKKTRSMRAQNAKKRNLILLYVILGFILIFGLVLAALYSLGMIQGVIWLLYWYQFYIYTGLAVIALFAYMIYLLMPVIRRLIAKRRRAAAIRKRARERREAKVKAKEDIKTETRDGKKRSKARVIVLWSAAIIILLIAGIYASLILFGDKGEAEAPGYFQGLEPYYSYGALAVLFFVVLGLVMMVFFGKGPGSEGVKNHIKKSLIRLGISFGVIVLIAFAIGSLAYFKLLPAILDFVIAYRIYFLIGFLLLVLIITGFRFHSGLYRIFFEQKKK